MPSLMRAFAALLLLAGCGDDMNAPAGPLLLGQWGTAGESPALLIGLRVGAELQLACSSVGTDRPVELGADGRFAFRGRWHTSSSVRQEVMAQVTGQVAGALVTLSVDVLEDDTPGEALTLRQGVDPDFEDLPPVCLL